jgi:hypothetical protein
MNAKQNGLSANGVAVDEVGNKLRAIAKRVSSSQPLTRKRRQQETYFVPAPESITGTEPDDYEFLRDYVNFSRHWSPRSVRASHETVALWVLSSAAAGRVVFHYGGQQRAFLYQFLVASSALYAKSTVAGIGRDVLEAAGLARVQIGRATPQSFFDQCVEKVPSDWSSRSAEQQTRVLDKLRNAGQRSWYADEFGAWSESMLREGSVNYQFRELLLQIFDSPEEIEYSTVGRGEQYIFRPTLSLLAVSTYADLRRIAAAGSPLWRDGLFSRFAWVTTDDDESPSDEDFPRGQRVLPTSSVRLLQEFDAMLGRPAVSVSPVYDQSGNGKGKEPKIVRHDVKVERPAEYVVDLSDEFRDALHSYDVFTRKQVSSDDFPEDLQSSYGRFAAVCARTAVLLAASEFRTECTLRDFRKAVAITERSRRSLHLTYYRLTDRTGAAEKVARTDALLRYVATQRVVALREIHRRFHREYPQGVREVETELDALVRAGDLHVVQLKRKQKQYAVDAHYLEELRAEQ